MRSILEEFAYGNILPNHQRIDNNSPFGQSMRALSHNEEKLLARLNEEDKVIFEKYLEAQSEVKQLTAVKNFVEGYKLGLLMTSEAFVTANSVIDGEA